jgi:hypothetical protein
MGGDAEKSTILTQRGAFAIMLNEFEDGPAGSIADSYLPPGRIQL